jgi:hypothetical protein
MAPGRALVVALVALCAACRHPIVPVTSAVAGLPGSGKVYTLANLHTDDRDKVVSAANFQYVNVIPVCSEVSLVAADQKSLQFRVMATGQDYTYVYHGAAGEPFDRVLARYFGPACPRAELDALSPVEKEGVRLGSALKGMRKQAVILAMGYPPLSATRTLELPTWQYWATSGTSFIVVFDDDGSVQGIRY